MTDQVITRALDRALEFLQRAQLPYGEFTAYIASDPTMQAQLCVDSTPFVTAMIVYCLHFVDSPAARAMAQQGCLFLQSEREGPGCWRYWSSYNPKHFRIPPDTDDTSFVPFVLRLYGFDAKVNAALLLSARNPQGLYYNWILARRSVWLNFRFWRAVLPHAFMFMPHTYAWLWNNAPAKPDDVGCGVNANVLLLLGARAETQAVIANLIEVVHNEREATCDVHYALPFSFYYLVSRAYLHGVTALAPIQQPIRARIRARWDAQEFESPLRAASEMCALLNFNQPPSVLQRAGDYLIQTQGEDGAWSRAPMWWGGLKKLTGFGSEELTTALCVEALARLRAAQEK